MKNSNGISKKARDKTINWGKFSLLAPSLLILIVFFALPYLYMAGLSFLKYHPEDFNIYGFSFDNYSAVLGDGYFWNVLINTINIGVISTLIALLLGYPVAYHLTKIKKKYRTFFLFLVLAPLMVGLVIRSYGWMVLLQNQGLINQFLIFLGVINEPIELMYNSFGVIVALVHIFLPFMILPITGSLQGINPDLQLAARSLGAKPLKIFLKVTLPLSLPGVISGTTLVFLMTVSSYAIPMLLGKSEVMMSSMLIVQVIMETLNWPLGAAMSVIFFSIAVLLLLIYNKIVERFVRGLNVK